MQELYKLRQELEKGLKVTPQEEMTVKIKTILKKALEILLSDERLENGEELTKISLKEGSIHLYTGVGSQMKPQPYPIVEDPTMDMDSLENFLSQYPRIRVIDPQAERKVIIDTNLNRLRLVEQQVMDMARERETYTDPEVREKITEEMMKLKTEADSLRTELTTYLTESKKIYEEQGVYRTGRKYYLAEVTKTSDSVDITKNVIYIDRSLESIKDPRIDSEKMAEFQVEGNTDFTLHQMIKHGYTEGMLTEIDKSAYGYNEVTGKYDKLGTNEYTGNTSQKRSLAFKKLNYPLKENTLPRSNVIFIETRVNEKVEPDRDLIRIFNSNKKGIIILDKLLASDLLRSEAFKEGEIRTVHNMGVGVSHDNPTLVVSNEGSNYPTDDSIRRLKAGKFSAIIDTSSKLTVKQVLELSQTQLVVLNWPLKRIESTFNSILLELDNNLELYHRFIDNILYLGDFRNAIGEQILDTNRKLLKEKKFKYFGEISNTNQSLKSVLRYLHDFRVEEVGVKDNIAYVTMDGVERNVSVNKKPLIIDDYSIINLLWKTIASGEPEDMIKELETKKIYSLVFEMTTLKKVSDEVNELVRITVFNTGRNLNLVARRLQEPVDADRDTFQEQNLFGDSRIMTFSGSSLETNIRMSKTFLKWSDEDLRFLIIDDMYEFDVLEFKSKNVDQIMVLRDLDSISSSLVRNFNPDLVIYNAEYQADKIAEVVKSVKRDTRLIFTGEYNLFEFLDTDLERNYGNMVVLETVKSMTNVLDTGKYLMGDGKDAVKPILEIIKPEASIEDKIKEEVFKEPEKRVIREIEDEDTSVLENIDTEEIDRIENRRVVGNSDNESFDNLWMISEDFVTNYEDEKETKEDDSKLRDMYWNSDTSVEQLFGDLGGGEEKDIEEIIEDTIPTEPDSIEEEDVDNLDRLIRGED